MKARGELVVVLFAGCGGSSVGLARALGREPDIAINHDRVALAVHQDNHPRTVHMVEDVWHSPPRKVVGRRRVGVLWASPDCTHFSAAKGGKPRESGRRSLAWVVVRWAEEVRPAVIFLENVREFQGWGPLGPDGMPDKARLGETFEQWVGRLGLLGYAVEWRVLNAADYGAATSRKRLFLVARCDGQPIRWPAPTHGPGRLPYRTAAECIDWSLPVPSIFGRKKPLAEKTLRRIAEGVRRYVLENPRPFIVKMRGQCHSSDVHAPLPTVTASGTHLGLVSPTLIQTGYGERTGQAPRVLDIQAPLGTVMATGQKHALVAAFLAKHYGGVVGTGVDVPASTITTTDHHALVTAQLEGVPDRREEVRAFLLAYYGSGGQWASLDAPCPTIVSKHRLGLVTVEGVEHVITDIGMRMLEPPELAAAQGFSRRFRFRKATTKRDQVRLVGNSVVPQVAEALARANLMRPAERRAA